MKSRKTIMLFSMNFVKQGLKVFSSLQRDTFEISINQNFAV